MKVLFEYNNNFIELDTNDLKEIGQGTESIVYSYNDKAIKVYKEKQTKIRLSYEEVEKLKEINTHRILLPQNTIYSDLDSNSFYYNGYTTKLIENIKKKKELLNISSDLLNNELHLLNEDINVITKNKIIIRDLWNKDNFVYNNHLYYVDPGSYTISENASISDIYEENIEELSMSLFRNIFCFEDSLELIKEELKK